MRMTYLALAGALLASTGAHAANTITALPQSDDLTVGTYGVTTDAFDVAQGSTIVDNSAVIFDPDHAIGGVTPGQGEPANVVFNGAGPGFITFKTATPVTIDGFNLYVGEDDPGSSTSGREFATIGLSGSTDGVTFSSLGSFDFTSTSYNAYGSNVLELTSTFAATTDQFFRIDEVSKAQGAAQGGRVLELDALSGSAASAVPEPATWATMIAGVGLVGGMMRRSRKVRTNIAYA